MNAKTRKIIGIFLVLLGFGMISGFLICGSIYLSTNWSQTYVCIILLVWAFFLICIGYGTIMKAIQNPDEE
ncbi:MAG: hypothetical protein ACFE9N_05830 [Promethearchaeota archaeon]